MRVSAADDPAETVKSWRHKLQKVRLVLLASSSSSSS